MPAAVRPRATGMAPACIAPVERRGRRRPEVVSKTYTGQIARVVNTCRNQLLKHLDSDLRMSPPQVMGMRENEDEDD